MSNTMEKNCLFYIRAQNSPPNPQQLKKQLSNGTLEQKVSSLKTLIRCIINDEAYPRMIMHIITTIIPVIHQSAQLRKTMLLYWEVIQKNKSPTDDTLKDEMFLACNSLRNDLLHSNEYLRGKTLRLISRILHKGIVDPLSNAIVENLAHKSSYVRRNAVVCLYQVFLNYGGDVIGDIDQEVQKLLLTETDLSTKRNAFLLLYQSNQNKAMNYIQNQMINQNLQEMGDILQLAILQIFRKKCKQDPSQKSKLLKIILDFSKKANQSVILECAVALTSISTSPSTLRNSLQAYVTILNSTTQLNVKKVILDKLETISGNSKYLEDIIGDLIKVLNTPSYEIKQKVLQIIRYGLTLKNAQKVLEQIESQFSKCEDKDYQKQLMKTLDYISYSFSQTHDKIIKTIIQKIFPSKSIQIQSSKIVKDILIKIILENQNQSEKILEKIIQSFNTIQSGELYKGILYILGTYINNPVLVGKAIDRIKISIGDLPITRRVQQTKQIQVVQGPVKKIVKTIILPDGSYGTKEIDEIQLHKQVKQKLVFRQLIVEDSILGGIMVRNVSKLFSKIKHNPVNYNKYGCSILMIFCSLLRFYQQNIYQVDQATIDQIATMIRMIVNPTEFLREKNINLLGEHLKYQKKSYQNQKDVDIIQKNPEDLIVFRQLKPRSNFYQIDFEDQQINQKPIQRTNQSSELITKLKTLIQLTGYFDPIYAQTFVTVKNYDIFFEILLMNNSNVNLLNVQIQFSSKQEINIIEKANNVNLKPGQSVYVRSHIKFSNSQFGSLFGNINYDNQAGIQQAYLVTEEIKIDFLQFIYPAQIPLSQFRQLWKKNLHERILDKETGNLNVGDVLKQHEKYMNSKVIDNNQNSFNDNFINAHVYGKSKLGEDFLVTITICRSEQKLKLSYIIRTKEKGMVNIIHQKLSEFKIEEYEQQANE